MQVLFGRSREPGTTAGLSKAPRPSTTNERARLQAEPRASGAGTFETTSPLASPDRRLVGWQIPSGTQELDTLQTPPAGGAEIEDPDAVLA